MKLKILLFFWWGVFWFASADAQRQYTYFLKNSGIQVNLRDSADYIQTIKEPDSGSVLYTIAEYYLSGKPKFTGKSSKREYLRFESECTRYYPSGNKQEVANYTAGKLLGDYYQYYPNGTLYVYKQYTANQINPLAKYNYDYRVITCNDSTGKVLTEKGNGNYIGYIDNFTAIEEQGGIKDGLRDGDWKGVAGEKSDQIKFIEKYEEGKIQSAKGEKADGTVYAYTIREIPPQFTGNGGDFSYFLGSHIVYPPSALKKEIQGTVYVSFVIENNGSLSSFKIVKSPDIDLSQEALRILKQSPNWTPRVLCGAPVKTEYTVPVKFTLAY